MVLCRSWKGGKTQLHDVISNCDCSFYCNFLYHSVMKSLTYYHFFLSCYSWNCHWRKKLATFFPTYSSWHCKGNPNSSTEVAVRCIHDIFGYEKVKLSLWHIINVLSKILVNRRSLTLTFVFVLFVSYLLLEDANNLTSLCQLTCLPFCTRAVSDFLQMTKHFIISSSIKCKTELIKNSV